MPLGERFPASSFAPGMAQTGHFSGPDHIARTIGSPPTVHSWTLPVKSYGISQGGIATGSAVRGRHGIHNRAERCMPSSAVTSSSSAYPTPAMGESGPHGSIGRARTPASVKKGILCWEPIILRIGAVRKAGARESCRTSGNRRPFFGAGGTDRQWSERSDLSPTGNGW